MGKTPLSLTLIGYAIIAICAVGAAFGTYLISIDPASKQEARTESAAEARHARTEDAADARLDKVMASHAEMKAILEKTNQSMEGRLKKSYALGYALFYINRDRMIFSPHTDDKNIEIDWSKVSVAELTAMRVIVTAPTWTDKKSWVVFKGPFKIGIERKPGFSFSPFRTRTRAIVMECLKSDHEGVVAVIGFTELPSKGVPGTEALENLGPLRSVQEIEAYLIRQNESFESAFRAFFPLGYALFYMDQERVTFVDASQGIIKIDWGAVSLAKLVDEEITISLPGWSDNVATYPGGSNLAVKRELGEIAGPNDLHNQKVAVEYLATVGRGAVVVIGFSYGSN